MDMHLKSVHNMLKGTEEFEKSLREATMYQGREQNTDLQRALADYG